MLVFNTYRLCSSLMLVRKYTSIWHSFWCENLNGCGRYSEPKSQLVRLLTTMSSGIGIYGPWSRVRTDNSFVCNALPVSENPISCRQLMIVTFGFENSCSHFIQLTNGCFTCDTLRVVYKNLIRQQSIIISESPYRYTGGLCKVIIVQYCYDELMKSQLRYFSDRALYINL